MFTVNSFIYLQSPFFSHSYTRPIEVAYLNYKCIDWNLQRECIVIDFNQMKVESAKLLVIVPCKSSYVTCCYHGLASWFCVGGCKKNDVNLDFIFSEILTTTNPVRTISNLITVLQPAYQDQCIINYDDREAALKERNKMNDTKFRINKVPCLEWMVSGTFSASSFRSGGCNQILEADRCGLKEASERYSNNMYDFKMYGVLCIPD